MSKRSKSSGDKPDNVPIKWFPVIPESIMEAEYNYVCSALKESLKK